MARKTVEIVELLEKVNKLLAIPSYPIDGKKAVAGLLEYVLHTTDNYSGFGYLAPYDAGNWTEAKDCSRVYYKHSRLI